MTKMLRKMIGLSVVMAMVFTLFMPIMVSAISTITFDLNGGTYTNGIFPGRIATITVKSSYGVDLEAIPEDFIDTKLKPEYFRREGYTFKGWSEYSDDSSWVVDNEYLKLKGFIFGDKTFYAIWEKNNEPVPAPQPEPGPAPQPEPGPAPQPEPGPAPQPQPQPAPQPEPGPVPQPEPGPAPQPQPQPAPQPEPAPQHSDSGKREVATLAAPSGNPKTGDPSGNPKTGDVEILLWAGFMAVSMLGLTAVIAFLKKVR